MTSSVTSTEKGLTTRGPDGPPAVGPSSGPPEPRRGLSPDMTRKLAMAAFVWLPALGIVAALYGGKLTVGALFLALGWVSFALAAWHIGRAALAFDVTPAEHLTLEETVDEDRRLELLREKKILLKAIKEIEFDHQMGKVDDRDAAEISATYRARALEIMRLLDENKSNDYHTIVEKELARRLLKAGGAAKKALPAGEPSDEAAEPVLRPAVDTGTTSAASVPGKCGECGTRNDEDAVFCKKCAARLSP